MGKFANVPLRALLKTAAPAMPASLARYGTGNVQAMTPQQVNTSWSQPGAGLPPSSAAPQPAAPTAAGPAPKPPPAR